MVVVVVVVVEMAVMGRGVMRILGMVVVVVTGKGNE